MPAFIQRKVSGHVLPAVQPFQAPKNLIINNQTTSLLCLSILDVHPILTAPAKRAHTRSGVLQATHLLTSADICY